MVRRGSAEGGEEGNDGAAAPAAATERKLMPALCCHTVNEF